jgi:hypothetical protein
LRISLSLCCSAQRSQPNRLSPTISAEWLRRVHARSLMISALLRGRLPRLPFANMPDTELLQQRIAELQHEHRGLDQAIEALQDVAPMDELGLKRLKKRKLQVKDTIVLLQMRLVPDVPA